MHMYRRELLYASLLATALAIVGLFGAQLLRSYSQVTSASSQTACQLVAYQSVQSSRVALAALVTGTFVMVILKIVASAMLYHQMSTQLVKKRSTRLPTKLHRLCKNLHIDPQQLLLVQDDRYTALTIGTHSPYFVLSTALVARLTQSQLEAVLLHERHHAQHFHPLLLLFAHVTSKTLFFMPLLADLTRHMREEFEYQADQAAARSQHTTQHLRRAMEFVLEHSTPSIAPVAAFSSADFQQRIISLDHHRQPRFHTSATSALITTLVLGAGLLLAHPVAAQNPTTPVAGPACTFLRCVSACMQETVELAKSGATRSSERGIASPATHHSSRL